MSLYTSTLDNIVTPLSSMASSPLNASIEGEGTWKNAREESSEPLRMLAICRSIGAYGHDLQKKDAQAE